MPTPSSNIPRLGDREPITPSYLNAILDALVGRITVTGGSAKRVGGSVVIDVHRQHNNPGMTRFEVVEEMDDHLVCKRQWPDGTDAKEVNVAKPVHLRGSTGSRVSEETGELETVHPAYAVGDTVFAYVVNGGTGVEAVRWMEFGNHRQWTVECSSE